MRLVRYNGAGDIRLGALAEDREVVIDLQAAAAAYLRDRGDPLATGEAKLRIPADTVGFLQGGVRSRSLAEAAVDYALGTRNGIDRSLVVPHSKVRLEAPLIPSLIVCGGGNFWGHLRESGRDKPEHVEFFLKNSSGVLGSNDDIPYQPKISTKLDYEAELGIVVGKRGRCIPRERALEHVFGYTVVNDMAIRDRQLCRYAGSYFQVKYGDGKVFDSNFVLGPELVTTDEVPNPRNLSIRCWVNGELRQDSNTSEYIWGVEDVIEYYSRIITLEPGFLLCPGTPGGCAVGSDPDCGGRDIGRAPGSGYLIPGNIVAIEIGGIGRIENRVRYAPVQIPAPSGAT